MGLHELVFEIKSLERRFALYEEKCSFVSEDFYQILKTGKLEQYDEFDETRSDFSRWKGIFETWRRRKLKYDAQLKGHDVSSFLRFQPVY